MRVRVGNWKTGLGVMMDEEAYDAVRRQGKAVLVTMLSDRRLQISGGKAQNRSGHVDRFGGTAAAYKRPPGFHAEAEVVPDTSLMGPDFDELPLFCIHELPVDYDYASDALITAPLEADHLLPWPLDKHRSQRLSGPELQRQCYLRVRSHVLSGGHGYFDEVGVPVEVVRIMAGGYRLVLEKVRAEVDARQARAA